MSKFYELSTFLREFTGCPEGSFQAVVKKGSPISMGRHLGYLMDVEGSVNREQVELCIWSYEAEISIEGYTGDESRFIAALSAWMLDNAPNREELSDPAVSIALGAAGGKKLIVTVEFEERLVLRENEAGEIRLKGKRWSLAEPEIVPAQDLSLDCGVKRKSGASPRQWLAG